MFLYFKLFFLFFNKYNFKNKSDKLKSENKLDKLRD